MACLINTHHMCIRASHTLERDLTAICLFLFSGCGYYIDTSMHTNVLPLYRAENTHHYPQKMYRKCYDRYLPPYFSYKCLHFSYLQELFLFTLIVGLWGFCLLCCDKNMTLEIMKEKSCSLKTECFKVTQE